MIDEYVIYERAITAGFVVIKRAYALNCFCPKSPGMNNCKLPARCPNKNKTKNPPERAAKAF